MRLANHLFLLFLLTACSSPRYQVSYDFTPPGDQAGRLCLQDCYEDQKQCQLDCEREQAMCREEARDDAERIHAGKQARYVDELRNYNLVLETYYAKYRNYENRKAALEEELRASRKLCKAGGREASLFCDRKKKVERELRLLRAPYKPAKPAEPSLQAEITRLQASCNKTCPCEAQYRSCYTSCGGTVKQRLICVDNCDQERQ